MSIGVLDKRIYQIFGKKNPGRELANIVITEYSQTFLIGSAALEVYNGKIGIAHMYTINC